MEEACNLPAFMIFVRLIFVIDYYSPQNIIFITMNFPVFSLFFMFAHINVGKLSVMVKEQQKLNILWA